MKTSAPSSRGDVDDCMRYWRRRVRPCGGQPRAASTSHPTQPCLQRRPRRPPPPPPPPPLPPQPKPPSCSGPPLATPLITPRPAAAAAAVQRTAAAKKASGTSGASAADARRLCSQALRPSQLLRRLLGPRRLRRRGPARGDLARAALRLPRVVRLDKTDGPRHRPRLFTVARRAAARRRLHHRTPRGHPVRFAHGALHSARCARAGRLRSARRARGDGLLGALHGERRAPRHRLLRPTVRVWSAADGALLGVLGVAVPPPPPAPDDQPGQNDDGEDDDEEGEEGEEEEEQEDARG